MDTENNLAAYSAETASLEAAAKEQIPDEKPAEKTYAGMTRRTLCLGIGGAVVMFAMGGLKFTPSNPLVRPPGGQDDDALVSACIRCEKCCEICPRGVIKPTHIEDGILNMRTPKLDFTSNWCDWCAEENDGVPLCATVCPTDALKLPEGATVENTILGKAQITEDWCLAYKLTGCRFCYDACPYEAIKLDADGCPVVDVDLCNGCGACESVCVSLQDVSISTGATDRAITVHPLAELEGE